tara:strand:+ start:3540 stop:3788 length:249 start_codon:yes stop_codon:yes gene_type:complete
VPVYCYKCSECKEEFEARHSMSFEGQACPACNSTNVFKIPSLSIEAHTRIHTSRVGKIVDSYISEVKKEIKQEKKDLKNREL